MERTRVVPIGEGSVVATDTVGGTSLSNRQNSARTSS